MIAELIIERQHVEEKRLDVIVERLVIAEELGEQTQVLTVQLRHVAVHLEHRQLVVSVDLIGRRVPQVTLRLR